MRRRHKQQNLPRDSLIRLSKALNDNAIRRFKHPHSGVLLSEQSSYDAVYHILQDESHPNRYTIGMAALGVLGEPA